MVCPSTSPAAGRAGNVGHREVGAIGRGQAAFASAASMA